MATHLVTGGAGYLGHQLARALRAKGEQVRILDLLPPPPLPAEIEVLQGDIRNRSLVARAMHGVEIVHHNAALVPVTKAGKEFWSVHVDGTRVALEAARSARAQFFIFVSTSAIFGLPERFPITDETPLCPIEDYGRSKLEGERLIREAAGRGLPCAIVRPRTIIGPGRLGIFRILYEWISEGRKIYLIGNGNHPHQFVHCDDVVDFLLRLSEQRKIGTYNIGAERFGTLREDLEELVRHAGTAARIVATPPALAMNALRFLDLLRLSPLGPWHYRTYHRPFYFDITRPMQELGWRPRYGNVDALAAAYDWYMEHRDEPEEADARSTHRKSVKQGLLKALKHLS